jgi:acyl carrier protein
MTAARFRALVAETLGVTVEDVTDTARFIDDLGADSLDTVEISMLAEEMFGLDLPHDAWDDAQTVGAALALINAAMANNGQRDPAHA